MTFKISIYGRDGAKNIITSSLHQSMVYCGLLRFTVGHDLLHTLGMLCSTSHVIYYIELFMFNQPCTLIGQTIIP